MEFLQRAFQPLTSRTSSISNIGSTGFLGGFFTKKGVPVTATTSLNLSAFFNGINIIANDYAVMPKKIYKKTDEGRDRVVDHPLVSVIEHRPNQYMISFVFEKLLIIDAILKGNGYAIIRRNPKTGYPSSLDYVDQSTTSVLVNKSEGEKYFKIGGVIYADADVLHVMGFTTNGIVGVGIVTYAAQSLGISLSSQEFATDYYNSKGVGVGVVETDNKLDKPAKERVQKGLSTALGNANIWKVPVLDDGLKFKQLSITPAESQFLQTNKFGIEEVARWLNLPPHKLKSLENATFSNIENQTIQHVQDSIKPWAISFDQEKNAKLFSRSDRSKGLYTKASIGHLLNADLKTKGEYYSKMVFSGVLTRNEIRALEEYNHIDGLSEPLTPVNAKLLEQIEIEIQALKNKKNE